MRTLLAAVAATGFMLGTAWASDSSMPAQSGPGNPAINTTGKNNSSMPVAGSNSFTMAEATSRIEAKGYTHVYGLKKDAQGVWRGRARKHGHSRPVSLDFQGNVN